MYLSPRKFCECSTQTGGFTVDTSAMPTCEKCMSPMLRLAPSMKTGKYTLHPLLKFFMSQLPPFSRPGICSHGSSVSALTGGSQNIVSGERNGSLADNHSHDGVYTAAWRHSEAYEHSTACTLLYTVVQHKRHSGRAHRAGCFRRDAVVVGRPLLDLPQHRVVGLRQQRCAMPGNSRDVSTQVEQAQNSNTNRLSATKDARG